MKRRAIVHLGHEKTGSTAIQSWLLSNHAALLDAGTLVPRRIGSPNHTRLVAACLDDGVFDNIKAHYLATDRLTEAAFRKAIFRKLDAELSRTRGWQQVVITSELISSRLHTRSEIARLVEALRRHVDEIRFVIFLRRQDDLAVSRFSSALRVGHGRYDDIWADLSPVHFAACPPGRVTADDVQFFDYEAILARFADISDAETIVLGHGLPQGPRDVVPVFAGVLGVEVAGHAPSRIENPAMSADAQYVISRLNRTNRAAWPSGVRNQPYRALLNRIEAEVTGPPRRVPRAEAEAFVARYAAGNARIEAEHGQGLPLFRKGFNHWPDRIDEGGMAVRLAPLVEVYAAEAALLPQREGVRRRGLAALWSLWRAQ